MRVTWRFLSRESRRPERDGRSRSMELRNEIIIEAPAERVWKALGERFMHFSDWAAPITASSPVGVAEPGVGVTRSCNIAPFGPVKAGVVKERLTRFDREAMAFEYQAASPDVRRSLAVATTTYLTASRRPAEGQQDRAASRPTRSRCGRGRARTR
jgi:hypothetical protein